MKALLSLFMFVCAGATHASDALVLLVGSKPDHPYATHMYELECRLLAACLEKNDGLQSQLVPAWPPTEEQLRLARSVVFYSAPAGSVLLADAHRDHFAKLMKRGVGFVAIHWGTGVGYDKVSESQVRRDQFKSWLGGWFRRPPCGIQVTRTDLKVVNKQHHIAQGWEEWKIHDEFYLNPVIHERATPLLQVTLEGKHHTVGWTMQREDTGRSVGITLGHFHHNFARNGFRRMLVNAIMWSAKVDIPEGGAIVKVDAKELLLPPVSSVTR